MSEGLLNKVRAYFFLPPGVFGQGALLHLAGYLLMPLVTGAPAGKAALPENTALPENASLPDEASFADIVMERLAGLPGDLLSYAALPKTIPGLLLFAAGMAAALLALNPFLKYRISPHPLSRTPHRLFTAGIYSLSRNPMYLSLLLMLAGLGGYALSLAFAGNPPLCVLFPEKTDPPGRTFSERDLTGIPRLS
jgi:hypothetical protein